MIDPDAAIVFESLPKIVPESKSAALFRMEMPKSIRISELEHCAVSSPGFGLKQSIAHPRRRLMAVDILGNHIEVSADEGGHLVFQQRFEVLMQAIHPGQFVGEVVAPRRVPVGEIDVDDTEAVDLRF